MKTTKLERLIAFIAGIIGEIGKVLKRNKKLFLALFLCLLVLSCSSVSLKNVEIRKSDGSTLKIESFKAFNIDEIELMRVIQDE